MLVEEREIERTYDVGDDFRLPDLESLPGVVGVSKPVTQTLRAVYFDTSDLRLAARGITLRRRSGGDDSGWHLKLPAATGDRDEIRVPLGRSTRTVPAALADLVKVYIRGVPLEPVARITTVRLSRRLLGDGDVVLAELADDDVTGSTLGGAPAHTEWREMEFELKAAGPDLLDAAGALRAANGATVSANQRKLIRVLGDEVPVTQPRRYRLRAKSPAGTVVQAYLNQQVEDLQTWDRAVRRDEYDSVHKMRVATRRLRSALRTFGQVVERDQTSELADELKWLATSLGQVRDREVQLARLESLLSALPPELVLGPVEARLTGQFAAEMAEARTRILADLDSPRYFALLDRLEALLQDPPFTPLARKPAGAALPRQVHRSWRRLDRAVAAAREAAPDRRAEALHDARKAAKRARYAGESVE